MRTASILHAPGWLPALVGSLLLALTTGCSVPLITTEEVVQAQSCVDVARSVRVTVAIGAPGFTVDWEGGSSNVVDTPLIDLVSPGAVVTAELDSVPLGGEVTLKFLTTSIPFETPVTIVGIDFYREPPDQIPPEPECPGIASPTLQVVTDPHLGLALQVSNPKPQPITLTKLELTKAPNLLPTSSLDWNAPDFNALPWQVAVAGGTVLDSAAPPLLVDLPEEAPGSNAALCRFVSSFQGGEIRGILQASLTSNQVPVTSAAWGAVKALYRK